MAREPKKYMLLRDLPGVKAGAQLVYNPEDDRWMLTDIGGIGFRPHFMDAHPDWFATVEPENGWHISSRSDYATQVIVSDPSKTISINFSMNGWIDQVAETTFRLAQEYVAWKNGTQAR